MSDGTICSQCGHEFDWNSDREDEDKDICDWCMDENIKDAQYEFWESYR